MHQQLQHPQHQVPQMPQMSQQQMPGHKYQNRQGPVLVLGQDPAPKCFSSPFRAQHSFAPAPAMAAPPIPQQRRMGQLGQQASMPNRLLPNPTSSEQEENTDPATKFTRTPTKFGAKSASSGPAAGRPPLRLRNMAVGASRGNEMVPTMVTSPKSMFATGPTQSRKRRMKPDYIETKRQYSEQHDQGIDFMAGFAMSAPPAERDIAVASCVKRRRSNLNLAIPA